MSLVISLGKVFGPSAAKLIFDALQKKNNGQNRLEKAAKLIDSGSSAISALQQAFGREFLETLSSMMESHSSKFSYEAGSEAYIRITDKRNSSSLSILRDEININLDRLTLMDPVNNISIENQFRGVLAMWQIRFRELTHDLHFDRNMIERNFGAMNKLLEGDDKNFKDLYSRLSATGIGGVGALMIISGSLLATSTGVGVLTAISTFLFGIPMATVGALVLPGALLVVLAAYQLKPKHKISVCVGLAYKTIEIAKKGI
jgi:hypothetical protein